MVTDTSPDKIEALKSYGLNFGMSYQLIDDAIDYSSNSSRLGKNVGDDFSQGKVTLPIILAYLRSNKEEDPNSYLVLVSSKALVTDSKFFFVASNVFS